VYGGQPDREGVSQNSTDSRAGTQRFTSTHVKHNGNCATWFSYRFYNLRIFLMALV